MSEISELFNNSGIDHFSDYKLSQVSSFRIGGIADLVIFPKNNEEFIKTVSLAKDNNIRFEVIGNGSNVLFSDKGYQGIIIITKKIDSFRINKNVLSVSCGAKLVSLARIARDNSLSGLEFACGIPGTIGGAISMNAGAYGGEMSDIVISSKLFDHSTKEIKEINNSDHNFKYRSSIYLTNKNYLCLSANLNLSSNARTKEEIDEIMKTNYESRRQKQPLELPNCGSYFKRPEGFFAAKLIDECNLKGTQIGGAQVSEKHAGFIVNTGNATAENVLELAELIKVRVYDKFGIILESEVKYIS